MPKIFISYRRDDSAYPAQAIRESLVSHFGHAAVFFDVDSIPLGKDFHDILNEAVAQCDVLLAVIGDQWLNIKDETGRRRLDDPNDFVRIEIEAALSRNIPVAPVLVGKASVPRVEDLPDCLKTFAKRNAAEVRPGKDFRNHLDRLVRSIEHVVEGTWKFKSADSAGCSTITSDTIGMKMILIPSGKFLMGSPYSEKTPMSEKPQHRVQITKPFYLGLHPLTQHQYEYVTGANPSDFKGDGRRPVENVTWVQAVEFCNLLSEQERLEPFYMIGKEIIEPLGGIGYRLPTEAEWEYACRAGTTTRWSFGDNEREVGHYAWYGSNSKSTTHSVGSKQPNPWGLFDMHGNVWEWCWDWHGLYPEDQARDPMGPKYGDVRILRGGSYCNHPVTIRSAYRDAEEPWFEHNNGGFRVARTYN